ncbi:prolipoprotein diacylglyceryl transferase [Aquimarina sp. 2201CG5-10]|uniref:prolipoprotein diacylglyceryl transferase n=1 Tax=Aquimarina callyspongiae TaxID=3098150 RepID=UPI002AB48F91|nr:prolipoprotein diacylglyceryl transferase [Aquimarina sp. 2201CG5-10]MDY8134999.1 prolipoprotein diacylglyceryl transferase [Aquimarina sp. 2201CG5-10]
MKSIFLSALRWDIDPEIFILFGTFPIKYYGILFVTGLLLSYEVVKRVYKSENIPVEDLEKLSTYLFIGIFVGARVGHCLFYDFAYFSKHPLEILLPFQVIDGNWHFTGYAGLASHGGAIGILIAIILYIKKTKTSFLWIMDKISIGIPIGCAFIRFGNFMNSEIYGKPTDGDYGVIFMRDDMIPRHPTQLYEAFSFLAVFVILWYLNKKKSSSVQNGFIFGLFLILMFSARLIIEFLKENQVAFEDSMALNMGQLLSIPFILAGAALLLINRKNFKFRTI